MKKIITCILMSLLLLTGCMSDSDSISDEQSEASSYTHTDRTDLNEQSRESDLLNTAKDLLRADKLITELFVEGLLTELIDTGEHRPAELIPATGCEYEDFHVIEKLLAATYTVAGGTIEKYLNFPKYGQKSIASINGKTYFSSHYTEKFEGVYIDGIWLSDGKNENEKLITAGGYTIPMIYDGSVWLLEDSVYFLSEQSWKKIKPENLFGDKGTARTLSGRILAVQIYVSDTRSEISDEEVLEFDSRIREATEFITEAASTYDTILHIEHKQLFYKYKGAINFSVNDLPSFDLVLAATSYKNLDKYINDNFDTEYYDGYFAVFCMDKQGESYSHPYKDTEDEEGSSVFFAERCAVFSNTTPREIVVNILELFGAEKQEGYFEELLSSYCENDIMLGGSLETSVFCELTAYQTRILSRLDKQFAVFLPRVKEQEEKSEIQGSIIDNSSLLK